MDGLYIYIYVWKTLLRSWMIWGENPLFPETSRLRLAMYGLFTGKFSRKKMATGKRENGLVEDSHHMEHMGVVHGG